MSAPGPVVVGAALFFGRSSTQLADFIRRSAELLAIIVSWIIYNKISRTENISTAKVEKLGRIANFSVALTMFISGTVILFVALASSGHGGTNVIPGLVIAILGAVTNTWFWQRYRSLNRRSPNIIFAVQSRLYLGKSVVDLCVAAALLTLVIAPGTDAARYVDLIGSVIVSIYLLVNAVMIFLGKKNIVSKVPATEIIHSEIGDLNQQ